MGRAKGDRPAAAERYRSYFRYSPDGVFVVDRAGRYLEVNDAACNLSGYSGEELLRMSVTDIVAPEDKESAGKYFQHLVEHGRSRGQVTCVRKDGTRFSMMFDAVTLSADRHIGFCRDITEWKTAEMALRRRESILEAVSFAARRILQVEAWQDSAPELIEKLGRAAEVSRVRFFGWEPGAGGRQRARQLHEWVAPGVARQIDDAEMQEFDPRANGFGRWVDRLTRGEPVVGKVREFPAAERRFLERQQIQSILVVPIVAGDLWGTIGFDECAAEREWTAGEIDALKVAAGIVAAAVQRERADAERSRLERNLRDSQRLESLGALAGGIAHDFNNLLAGVLGNASMALQDLPTGSSVRGFVEQIDRSARRAAELVRQLLTYSGKGRLAVAPVCLSSLVREMAELLELSISRRAILRLDFGTGLPAVEADATELRQVVMNLIVNAAEAMEERGGEIRLRTGVHQCSREELTRMVLGETLPAGRYVFVEVADEGCGMSEEVRGQMFDPYFSTKLAGRGVGLAAVLGIVRGHGGALEVSSHGERGTMIRVFFPAADTPATDAAPREEPVGTGWEGHGTVLVVDDDETVLETARTMLGRMNYEVVTARSGPEGLDRMRERPEDIDLVLLDMSMPGMGGAETYRVLRGIRRDVPVILSSGFGEEAARPLCDGPGCGFLPKPYRQDELARKIRELLEPRAH